MTTTSASSSQPQHTPTTTTRKKRKIQQQHTARTPALTPARSTRTPTSKRRKIKDPHNQKLSSLESLPSELLAQIFLEDCSVSLPRASPYLTRALRGEYVKRKFCDKIVGHYRIRTGTQTWKHSFALNAGLLTESWNPFAMRWVTWDYICEAAERALERPRQPLANNISWFESSTMPRGQPRRQWLKWLVDGTSDLEQQLYVELWYDEKYLIPAKLLRWPITTEHLDFLDFLVQTCCRIDKPSESLVGEVAAESALKAIEAKDYRLVHRLLEHGILAQPSIDDIARALETITWDPRMIRLIERCTATLGTGPKLRMWASAYYGGSQSFLMRLGSYEKREELKYYWSGYPCPYSQERSSSAQCMVCLRATDKHKTLWHTLAECEEVDEKKPKRDAIGHVATPS